MATAASSVAPLVTLYHADQAAHFPSNSTFPITEIHKDDLESQLNENKRSVSVNIGINPAQSQEVTPTGPIPPPEITDTIEIDENVVKG